MNEMTHNQEELQKQFEGELTEKFQQDLQDQLQAKAQELESQKKMVWRERDKVREKVRRTEKQMLEWT